MVQLKIVGFQSGSPKIPVIQILRLYLISSLKEATQITQEIFNGKHFEFEIETVEKAMIIAKRLTEAGIIIEME